MATRKEIRLENGELHPDEKAKLVAWCIAEFEPATEIHFMSAHGMTKTFGKSPDGFYANKDEFAEAMEAAGFPICYHTRYSIFSGKEIPLQEGFRVKFKSIFLKGSFASWLKLQ